MNKKTFFNGHLLRTVLSYVKNAILRFRASMSQDIGNCQDKSEALYQKLRETIPYENIRMAVGRYKGHPHQWVEIWEDGQWWIEDPTLGNFNNPKHYVTYHHLGWETIMKYEMPDKLKERDSEYKVKSKFGK